MSESSADNSLKEPLLQHLMRQHSYWQEKLFWQVQEPSHPVSSPSLRHLLSGVGYRPWHGQDNTKQFCPWNINLNEELGEWTRSLDFIIVLLLFLFFFLSPLTRMMKVLLPDLGTCQESVCCLKMISASKHLTYEYAYHLTCSTKTFAI